MAPRVRTFPVRTPRAGPLQNKQQEAFRGTRAEEGTSGKGFVGHSGSRSVFTQTRTHAPPKGCQARGPNPISGKKNPLTLSTRRRRATSARAPTFWALGHSDRQNTLRPAASRVRASPGVEKWRHLQSPSRDATAAAPKPAARLLCRLRALGAGLLVALSLLLPVSVTADRSPGCAEVEGRWPDSVARALHGVLLLREGLADV